MNVNQIIEVCCPYTLEKANPSDVGYDLKYTGEPVTFKFAERKLLQTGCKIRTNGNRPFYTMFGRKTNIRTLKFEEEIMAMPFGFDAEVRGRSSMAVKGFVTHHGTIDEHYHSEIKVLLFYLGVEPYTINTGDKIAQLKIGTFIPCQISPVEAMEDKRGGFGSSGT